MDEDKKEWSDLTCTLVVSLLVLVIFTPMFFSTSSLNIVLPVYLGLVASYAGLIKMFGSGSVVSMGILIMLLTIILASVLPGEGFLN